MPDEKPKAMPPEALPEKLSKVDAKLREAFEPVGFDVLNIGEGVSSAPDIVDAPPSYSLVDSIPVRSLYDEHIKYGVQLISLQPLYSFVVDLNGKPLINTDLVLQFSVELGIPLKHLSVSAYKLEAPLFVSNRCVVLPERLLGFWEPELFDRFRGWLRQLVLVDSSLPAGPVRQFVVKTGKRSLPVPGDTANMLHVSFAYPIGEQTTQHKMWAPNAYLDAYGAFHIDY